MAGLTLNKAERRELISALVTNCAGWDREDIDILVNMSPEKLLTHAEGCAQLIANEDIDESSELSDELEPSSAEELQDAAEDEGWDDETISSSSPPTSGAAAKTPASDQPKKCHDEDGDEIDCPEGEDAEGENVTENEYLNYLPPRIREVVINALEFDHSQKVNLVTSIVANNRNRFSSDYLMTKDTKELQALADLASPQKRSQPMFVGASGGPVTNETFDRDDILTIPTLEFAQENN